MKKIFFTLFIVALFSINQSIYAEICPIEGAPPDSIKTYIKDLRVVISNITDEAVGQEWVFPVWDKLRGWMNSIISWQDYSTEFDFYITESIFNEIPNEIRRDDRLFSREIENIERYLWFISKKWLYSAKITNPCWAIDQTKCKLKNGDAWDLIISLLDNTKKIKNSIQYSTIWKWIYETNSLILTNENLVKDIKVTYKQAKTLCSKSESGFFNTVKEKISNISLNNEIAKDWIKEWENAWKILTWLTPNQSHRLEKELLMWELWRQWVSWDQAQMIINNLNDYNKKWGYNLDNNPLTNTFNSLKNSIPTEWDSFWKSISDWFSDNATWKVTIQSLMTDDEKIEKTFSIKTNIETLYRKQEPLAQIQDLDNTKILLKIIEIHNTLWISINLLEKTIPISQKVCNDQAEGKWKCEY